MGLLNTKKFCIQLPVEYCNYLELKEMLGSCEGVYTAYGDYNTTALVYKPEECTEKTLKRIATLEETLEEYPSANDRRVSEYEWGLCEGAAADILDSSDLFCENKVPCTEDNINIVAHYLYTHCGYSSPYKVDYGESIEKDAFAYLQRQKEWDNEQ